MTISRLDFGALAARPSTLVVCVLVAGVPLVLVPAGVTATATAVSSGTVDPLWWPGVGALEYDLPASTGISPVRAWLDPATVWEVYRRVDPVKGDAKVDALTFDLFDPDGEATAILSGPRARAATLLTASISATATSIPVASTSTLPSTGIAWLGREAVIYDGSGGSALSITTAPAQRGAFGSRARSVRFDATRPPVVSVGDWPQWLQGRLASVWLARLDGTTLTDPSCLFLGTVGPGVQRSRRGTRWQIPLDNVVETLSRKIAPRTLSLFGIAHLDTASGSRSPLAAGQRTFLGSTLTQDRDGWHGDAASFLDDWNDAASAVYADTVRAELGGRLLSVRETGVGAGASTSVRASWDVPPLVDVTADSAGVARWVSREAMPDTVLHLDGRVPLPAEGDAAKLPAVLSWAVGEASAQYTLTVPRTARSREPLVARVDATGSNGSVDYVAVSALISAVSERDRQQATLITERTTATLGVTASGAPIDALRAASLALDGLDGGLHEDAIDWDAIARAFVAVPLPSVPSARIYTLGGEDTVLLVLSHEARLRGMAMASRWGRLTVFRTAVFASTEETVASITEADILCDDGGVPIEPEVVDAPQPVATSMTFRLPGGLAYQWIDDTARAAFGDSSDVECRALQWVPPGADLLGVVSALASTAQQVLGVLAEPYRVVRLTLGLPSYGLQEGDLVELTHPRVPTYAGTLGVSGVTCQVQEVRSSTFGGRARVTVALRLQEPDLAGYAPEALVAAGGISGMVVTVDTASAFGPTCFSRAVRPDGTAATSPVDGFAAGQRVRLSQLARSPIADEMFTIVAVDPVAGTLTLDVAPTLSMIAAAASAYGVIVRFDSWSAVSMGAMADDQRRYLFLANHTTLSLGSGDSPKRWAA